MIEIRDAAGRSGETGIRTRSLLKERVGFRDEQAGGDSWALWARRTAGVAMILFGLAVLLSNLVGGT